MADPDLKNGYTKIANEILEAVIRAGLNGAETAVLLYVVRKTYGFSKKEDEISLTQFEKATGYTRPTVCKAVKNLLLVKILLLVNCGNSRTSANRYLLNKDYDSWQLVKKPLLVNKPKLVKDRKRTSKGLEMELVKKPLHTKETLTKETIQKKIVSKDTISKASENFGNKEINKMIEALKQKIGIDDFADSQRWNRIYAKHCVTLLNKIGKDEFVRRLDIILADQFKHKNCNKIRYVYEQIKGFIESDTSRYEI